MNGGWELSAWTVLGFFGQFMFGLRFIIQWLASEKAKRVVVPKVFWYFSIAGSLVTLVYAIHRHDVVFTLTMCLNSSIYVRNLMLWKPETGGVIKEADPAPSPAPPKE